MKKQATPNTELKKFISKLGLKTKVCLRNTKFAKKNGAVILQSARGRHWEACKNENYVYCHDCQPPTFFMDFYLSENWKVCFFLTKDTTKKKQIIVLLIVNKMFIQLKN